MTTTNPDPAELLAGSGPLLRKLARRWWTPATADTADDLAQGIALRALVRLRAGKYDPARFRNGFGCWLALVARTEALDARIKRRSPSRRPVLARQFAVLDAETGETAEALVVDHRDGGEVPDHAGQERKLSHVRQAVRRLRPRQGQAVIRRYGLDGRGVRSMAAIDPARDSKSNREAVRRGVGALRTMLAE